MFDLFAALQCRDGIVTWIKKKIGPGVANITTLDEAERILTAESKVVLGFLNSLVVSFQTQLVCQTNVSDNLSSLFD